MASRPPKGNSDTNAWVCLNDYLRLSLGKDGENIIINKNGNNPPSIGQGTNFAFYQTDTSYTISSLTATGNNEYTAGSTPTYYLGEAIFENSASVTFTWGGTTRGQTLPAIANGDWYIYTIGNYDNSTATVGQGDYNLSSTFTPTWSDVFGGFYSSTTMRILGRLTVTGGATVSEVMRYGTRTEARGYNETKSIYGSTSSSSQIVLEQVRCDIDGKMIEYVEDVTLAPTWVNAAWHAICINETTGDLSANASSTFDNWTITGNQLNMMSIYDEDKKYCSDSISSVYHRVLAVALTTAASTAFDIMIPIKNKPLDYAYYNSNTSESFADNTAETINFEDCVVDINSNVTVGASWKFEPSENTIYSINSVFRWDTSDAWAQGDLSTLSLRDAATALQTVDYKEVETAFAGHIIVMKCATTYHCLTSYDLNLRALQQTGGALDSNNSAFNKWIVIKQLGE